MNIHDRMEAGLYARRELGESVDPGLNQAILRLVDEWDVARHEAMACAVCSVLFLSLRKTVNNCRAWVTDDDDPSWEGHIRLDDRRDGRTITLEENPVNTRNPRRPILVANIRRITEHAYDPRK